MKRNLAIGFFTAIVMLVAPFITACDPNTSTFTVSFNSNGGSSVSSITGLESGATISKPSDPTRDGYTFGGWYKDNTTFANAWIFATDTVTANIELHAKWISNTPVALTTAILSGTAGANVVEKAVNYANAHPGNYTLSLTESLSVNPQTLYADYTSLTITSESEVTISLGSNGSLFTVSGGAKLVIGGSISLQGKDDNNASLVRVYSRSSLELKDSAKISGNTANDDYSNGGGVFVHNNASFTMNGGTISDNICTSSGGGVYVSGGTFTMSGGIISDNTVNGDYGNGGGVYVYNASFTMNSGTISGNTVSNNGGGVAISNGSFTMNGGTISGNSANVTSGGVGVGGSFIMNGGTISGNSAVYSGGGVRVYDNGSFTMNDGTISGNTTGSGGGVFVGVWGNSVVTFTMNGGTISGNSATNPNGGGGVYVNSYGSPVFRISNGTIHGSDAETELENTSTDGAALYVNTGCTAQRGTFTGDTWTSKGDLATTNNTINIENGDEV